MEQIMNYVKPELIVVAIVLYFCGMALKQTQVVKDKYIPMLLGAGGIVLCGIWVLATSPLGNGQEIAMAVFTAIVQGILMAGLSNYVNLYHINQLRSYKTLFRVPAYFLLPECHLQESFLRRQKYDLRLY